MSSIKKEANANQPPVSLKANNRAVRQLSDSLPYVLPANAGSHEVVIPREGEFVGSSLRATGSRECAADDRLREAIHRPRRHCERSEAIHRAAQRKNGLLRFARNDVELQTRFRDLAAQCARAVEKSSAQRGRGERRMPVAPAASCALGSGRTHTSNNEYPGITRRSRTQWF